MQERFDESAAIRAARVFTYFLEHPEDKKAYIAGSNKHLVILTVLAYYMECSHVKLKRTFPILNLQDTTSILEEAGYIEINNKGGRDKSYTLSSRILELINDIRETFSKDTLYVFANCLMNMDAYIGKYGIKSWNMLALMIEAALKSAHTTQYVDLSQDSILSIPGYPANRMACRKSLEEIGVIKPRIAGGRSINGGMFALNKNAYVMEKK